MGITLKHRFVSQSVVGEHWGMLKLLTKAHVSPETGGNPKVWDNQSTPAWLPTAKLLLTTGSFVQTAPWNLALGSLTWLWNLFCIWTPLYVPPKSLLGKQVELEGPQVFPEQGGRALCSGGRWDFQGWLGNKNYFYPNKLPKCQTKPLSTTFKHNRQAHTVLWAERSKTAPKSSPVRAQMCSIWAQIQVEHWHLLSLQCQLYLYIRSISISGSSWCSFILTVSDRIIWRLNTKSWTCEK